MSDTCTSQEEDGSPSTVDGLEKRPLGGDPIPQTHANVEKEIDPAIESEPQPATDSVTLQDCINKDQDEQRLTELRYANPHGTFITGMDVDSEVGQNGHVKLERTVHLVTTALQFARYTILCL